MNLNYFQFASLVLEEKTIDLIASGPFSCKNIITQAQVITFYFRSLQNGMREGERRGNLVF